MSLFSGTPITAQTSSQTTTQVPQWMRDAIYNQVQTVQNVASLPFQQYTNPLVAGPTQNQQNVWQQASAGQNAWQQPTNNALSGLQSLTQQPGATSVAQPYVGAALESSGASAAQPWMQQAAQSGGLSTAQPYLSSGAQSAAGGIEQFMNPYNRGVTDEIARLGARNLSENLLPNVSDAFVRAGQFGGSRMGEFGSRALRDTQEAVLGEQARALQSGFSTALGASQEDLGRQLQAGQLAGNLGGQQQQTLTSLAQLAGQLGGQQQQAQLEAGQLLSGLQGSDLQRLQSLYGDLLGGSQTAQQQGILGRQELAGYGEQERDIQQSGLQAMYDQYLRAQQYPQQQTNYLTQQLSSLYPMVPSVNVNNSVSPVGMAPSTASQVAGGLSGLAGLLSQ